MKMIYNGTPIKSLNIKHYEMDTNSATMVPSDLQAGVTAFAKGKKVTGTGKAFEFATYGSLFTNSSFPVPNYINAIEIASTEYPIKHSISFEAMRNADFSTAIEVATLIKDGQSIPITVQVMNNVLTVSCSETFKIQLFYGKDNYI